MVRAFHSSALGQAGVGNGEVRSVHTWTCLFARGDSHRFEDLWRSKSVFVAIAEESSYGKHALGSSFGLHFGLVCAWVCASWH